MAAGPAGISLRAPAGGTPGPPSPRPRPARGRCCSSAGACSGGGRARRAEGLPGRPAGPCRRRPARSPGARRASRRPVERPGPPAEVGASRGAEPAAAGRDELRVLFLSAITFFTKYEKSIPWLDFSCRVMFTLLQTGVLLLCFLYSLLALQHPWVTRFVLPGALYYCLYNSGLSAAPLSHY